MWRAVEARDRGYDGRFVFAVRTTGIYCRPSCGARRPLRGNVSFHASPRSAEQAGFRPCLRCRPQDGNVASNMDRRIIDACREIATSETQPTLAVLARAAGTSPFHFQRAFKERLGVSPKGFASALRHECVRAALGSGGTITDAIHTAGYDSIARFYANAREILGMTTKNYRAGGAGLEIRYALAQTSLGTTLVATTNEGVCAILLGDDAEALVADLRRRFARANITSDTDAMSALVRTVVRMIDDPAAGCNLPLDIRGTAFQHRVWQTLRGIPSGETISYGELARRAGVPAATRAVAGACAANPIAVAVPCHRVVREDGGLSGFRWGVERKRALLAKEADTARAETDRPTLAPGRRRPGKV